MAMNRTAKRVMAGFAVLAVVVVVVALGVAHRRHAAGQQAAKAAAPPAPAVRGGGRSRADAGPVPVFVAPVTLRDLPVYLSGLGTVQAYNTVTVRAQVSGQLISVPFKEGDEIRKGDLLARIDPRSFLAALHQAEAKLAQDQAQLASARLDLARYSELAPSGYVSGQQLDQQRQLVAGDEALVKADQAAIEADRVQLSYTDIRAPIDGRLGIRQVDVGNLVSASDSTGIVVITQMKPISVLFTLPEQDLEQLRAAGPNLSVRALDRNNSQPLASGTLTVIDNQINQSTGTIELKATFPNTREALWPGQFVNVQLLVQTLHDVPTVPVAAVQRGPDGAYVYAVGKNDTVSMQTVTPGVAQGGYTQIVKGVVAGAQVVTDGQYLLKPGAKVRVQVAPASPASASAPAIAP